MDNLLTGSVQSWLAAAATLSPLIALIVGFEGAPVGCCGGGSSVGRALTRHWRAPRGRATDGRAAPQRRLIRRDAAALGETARRQSRLPSHSRCARFGLLGGSARRAAAGGRRMAAGREFRPDDQRSERSAGRTPEA